MACQMIYTINALTLLAAEKDPNYAAVLYRGDLLLADGIGAVWAIQRLAGKKPERVPGIDLIRDFAGTCSDSNQSLFLLGSRPGVALKAAQKLQTDFPRLRIAGCHDGFWQKDQDAAIIQMINQSGADLLLVGLGQPRQELFLDTYRDQLSVKTAIGVGGSFDVLSGKLKRAPRWMQRMGFEWLFRFVQEPSRLPRMLPLFEFVWRVFFKAKKFRAKKELL